MKQGTRALCVSASAHARLGRAAAWLTARGNAEPVLLVGAHAEAIQSLARPVAHRAGASFGATRLGLGRLAATLAAQALAERGLVAAGGLALEALCARVVNKLDEKGGLGRFAVVADRPGLPRALARSIGELRMAQVAATRLADPDLARVYAAYEAELEGARLADRAAVLHLAVARAKETAGAGAGTAEALLGLPTLLLDVAVGSTLERELVAALALRSEDLLATCPRGDERSRALLEGALGVTAEELPVPGSGALARLQEGLFREQTAAGASSDEVTILSAPGESRECVEIARRILAEAADGVPFDRIAVLLRSTAPYRAHLVEALRRAQVPVHFAQGTLLPDPSGRALLALLACAAEGLSARRFAEYVSLGEVPAANADGLPPEAALAGERFVAPDEDALPAVIARARLEEEDAASEEPAPAEVLAEGAPVTGGTLRAPRRWERLLVEAAVIGGRERWQKRLDGLAHERELDLRALEDPDSPSRERIQRELADLAALRTYALPLLDALADLPREATWHVWIDKLGELATRALRRPERVLAVLGELAPMAAVSGVDLREVRLALSKRLGDLLSLPGERRYGKVYVGAAEGARGLAFEVVFVPGLGEKIFPQKVAEDPILRDVERRALDPHLVHNDDRVLAERLALRLAVGAAKSRVCLSYPRIDTEQARPRTPSFYGLEVLRAAEGVLPGFDELARRAEKASLARLGWPAPASPLDAIDDAEHDLALLAQVFQRPEAETAGKARYLLGANVHLARALRFRFTRWEKKFYSSDGLVAPSELARPALAKHLPEARSFSPTALQNFATCPYKFVLYALHKLGPREEPEALEELNPLQKGSLVHDILYHLHVRLREVGMLPVRPSNLEAARAHLAAVVDEVSEKHRYDLCPAIPRVWEDGIASIKADLVEWLRRASEDPQWVPLHFELSFGLPDRRDAQDPASKKEDVPLDEGLRLRGSIDLVERHEDGRIRATDYKTGKARTKEGVVVGGGEVLQPVMYSLVLEKLLGANVEGGRLYYCTSAGDFKETLVPLNEEAREGARAVAKTIGDALREAFLPAAPVKGGCDYCDYKVVCGPYEEQRTKRKHPGPLKALATLRGRK